MNKVSIEDWVKVKKQRGWLWRKITGDYTDQNDLFYCEGCDLHFNYDDGPCPDCLIMIRRKIRPRIS